MKPIDSSVRDMLEVMLAVGRREEGARQGSFHLVRLSDEAALVALSLFHDKGYDFDAMLA